MQENKDKKNKRKKVVFLLGLLLLTSGLFFSFVNIEKTKAQYNDGFFGDNYYAGGGGTLDSVDLASNVATGPWDDIGEKIRDVVDWAKEKIYQAYHQAGDIAYKNSLRYFLNKVAQDTATYIATGGEGQKPLFVTSWNDYFQQVGDEALGDFFYRLGDEMWGVNLCHLEEPLVELNLTMAAKRAERLPRVECTWSEIKKEFNDMRDLKLNQLVEFSTRFRPTSHDLGAYLTIRVQSQRYQVEKENEANLVRIIEGGFKSVINPVTDTIKTPARVVDNSINTVFNKTFTPEETYTGNPFADAIGTFTNTLVSKYLDRVFNKGFNPSEGPQIVVSNFWSLGGRQATRLFFNEFASPNYQFNTGMRLSSLYIDGQEQYNNVIDDQFGQAIELECTVGQAAGYYKPGDEAFREECYGLISNSMNFGFDANGVEANPQTGLPYRSILVLRKFRVVPVGWELAANYYAKQKRGDFVSNQVLVPERLTLKYLLEQYNEKYVDENNSVVNPYYGLVNPDWLLKFPQTMCVKEGASSRLLPDSRFYVACSDPEYYGAGESECPQASRIYTIQRLDYCADYQSCIDDRSGACAQDDWGYCIEEEPVWGFGENAEECKKKYYATCETLTNTKTLTTKSYLLNTLSDLNSTVCTATNSGCRQYCDNYDVENEKWDCGASTSQDILLLTNQSEVCDAEDTGCSLFYTSADGYKVEDVNMNSPDYYGLDEGYVKVASDYYGCDEYTIQAGQYENREACENAGSFWRSDLEICVAGGSDECANYVKYCQAEDANCHLYTPESFKGESIPGVVEEKNCVADQTCDLVDKTDPNIVWNDECPQSCVGYKTYHQMETNFESGADVDLIAQNSGAQNCTQPGCDEFTNLDEVAQGGEGIEYYTFLRQCILPEEGGWGTYYTWEGSDTAGYQLKKWQLKESGGVPTGDTCSDLNDEDCREFYNQDLNSFRVLYSSSVVATENCHPFRRTADNTIYMGVPEESITCNESNNLCREYRSNQSYNYQNIVESYFESQSLEGWEALNGNAEISRESVRRDDYSLKLPAGGNIAYELTPGDLEEGKIYTLEFLIKNASYITASLEGQSKVSSQNLNLIENGEWMFHRLKIPANNIDGLSLEEAENTRLVIGVRATDAVYIDNIVFKEMESLMLVKDSWSVPEICDLPLEGEHLQCESYSREDGQNINLRSFDDFCFEDVVGCELAIDANNSKTDTSDDSQTYMVIDSEFACAEEAYGCTALGLIEPTATDPDVYNYSDMIKIVRPEDEPNSFCENHELYCQEYRAEDNAIYYFRDPVNRKCEYREDGWFVVGGEERCEDYSAYELTSGGYAQLPTDSYTGHCLGGVSQNPGNTCTDNSDCTNLANPGGKGICINWAGLCEENSSGCREYQDPQEPVDCNTDYRNYEYLYAGLCVDNTNPTNTAGVCQADADCTSGYSCVSQVEAEEVCNYYYYKDVVQCSQGVNPAQGCVGFYQTDNENKNIRSYPVCVSVDDSSNIGEVCNSDADCEDGYVCEYTNVN